MLYRQRLASLLPSRLQAVSPETWRRHWRTILAVKVTGVIVSVALAVVLVPEARTRDLFVALTAGVYLPISFLLYLFQRRDPTPPNPVWIAVTLVDIAMVAAVQALFPRLSLAFLALTAIVMVSAVLLGVRWAVLVATAASLALLSSWSAWATTPDAWST